MKKKNLSGLFSILLLLLLFAFTWDARSEDGADIKGCIVENQNGDGLQVNYDCLEEMGMDENIDVKDLITEALSEEN